MSLNVLKGPSARFAGLNFEPSPSRNTVTETHRFVKYLLPFIVGIEEPNSFRQHTAAVNWLTALVYIVMQTQFGIRDDGYSRAFTVSAPLL